jgi:uncharacterized membrane protein YfhO
VEYEPSRITLDVDSAEDGMLVLGEVYYPGWRARVDGSETRVHRVDYALRGVRLERGSHRVELVYDPVSLKVGLLITVVVLCLSGGMALLTTVGQRVPRIR